MIFFSKQNKFVFLLGEKPQHHIWISTERVSTTAKQCSKMSKFIPNGEDEND